MPDENKTDVVTDTNNNTEGGNEQEADFVKVSKSEWEKTNQTLGSLKRENKDLKKPKDEPNKETSSKPDDSKTLERIEKMAFKQANISHEDDIDLARSTAKKWNMDVEDVLSDGDFKIKLERQQAERDNLTATSKVRGAAGSSQLKNTPEYWIAKGTPPTPADVPDRKTRAKIVRALMTQEKSGGKFYNER